MCVCVCVLSRHHTTVCQTPATVPVTTLAPRTSWRPAPERGSPRDSTGEPQSDRTTQAHDSEIVVLLQALARLPISSSRVTAPALMLNVATGRAPACCQWFRPRHWPSAGPGPRALNLGRTGGTATGTAAGPEPAYCADSFSLSVRGRLHIRHG